MILINVHRGILTYPLHDYYKRAPWYLTYPIQVHLKLESRGKVHLFQ